MTGNRAVVLSASGPGVAVVEQPVPTPGLGEVLIATRLSLISAGTELALLSPEVGTTWGQWARELRAAQRPIGYCNVGTVVGVGPGVDARWQGARVASASPHAAFVLGSVQSSADRPSGGLVAVPDLVSDEAASLTSLAVTAMHGLRLGGLAFGESVAVLGMGLLGQLTVRLALMAGARRVVALARSDRRQTFLPDDPRVVGWALGEDSAQARWASELGPEGPDLVFDVSGDPKAVAAACELVRDQGTVVLLSSPRGPSTLDLHDLCCARSVRLVGAHVRSHPLTEGWTRARHAALALDWARAGLWDPGQLVTERVPFDRAPSVYQHLQHERSGQLGTVLTWSDAHSNLKQETSSC